MAKRVIGCGLPFVASLVQPIIERWPSLLIKQSIPTVLLQELLQAVSRGRQRFQSPEREYTIIKMAPVGWNFLIGAQLLASFVDSSDAQTRNSIPNGGFPHDYPGKPSTDFGPEWQSCKHNLAGSCCFSQLTFCCRLPGFSIHSQRHLSSEPKLGREYTC